MARVEVPIVVLNGSTGLPVNGAAVAISYRATGAAATWYTAETGGIASTAAAITDANGRITAWVDRGAYNLTISGTGITTYTEAWDATPGGDGTVDTAWVASNVVIPGEIKMYGGAAAPTGWLLCDGSPVSRITYAALFGALGTAFGVGDGSSTFNLPDLRGRMPIGAGTGSGLTNRTRGDKSGVETVTLTAAQSGLQDHEHHFNSTNAGGNPLTTNSTAGKNWQPMGTAGGGSQRTFNLPIDGGSFLVKLEVGLVPGGARDATSSHDNMPPWQAVNFIIKT